MDRAHCHAPRSTAAPARFSPASTVWRTLLCLLLAGAAVPASGSWWHQPPPEIPEFSNVTVHDPSLVQVGSEFYVFGSHLASASTTDWQNWTQITTDTDAAGGNMLVPDPAVQFQEAVSYVDSNAFFAPDVIQLADGRFYYYYCIGRLDAPIAALGLAVADDVTGPYENQGVLLRSGQFGQPSEDGTIYDPTVHPNAIDPDVFFDQDGTLWMVYGSYSGGIFILELNPETGLPLPGQGYGRKLTGGNHARIEGAYVIYSPESEYYFLFLSFGGLAADGGYNIRIGRSRNPDGPYFDAAGNDLIEAAGAPGTIFDDESIEPFGVKLMGNWQFLPEAGEPAQTTTGYVSPGHNSAYYDADTGQYFLVFHTRFVGRGEAHEVRVHQMYLNDDDWLVAAPHKYAGETLSEPHRFQVPGEYKVINHGKAISPAVNESRVVTLEHHGAITGAGGATGSWDIERRGNDIEIELDGVTYQGVFSTQWDDDQGAWVHAFSALSGDGVALWGSQVVASERPPFTVPLPSEQPPYGEVFETTIPEPWGRRNVYSYSVVDAPDGLTVDRATGVVTWQPNLLDVGVRQRVTIRALNIEAGDPHEIRYTFQARATSPTVVNREDLEFDRVADGGLQDADGQFTGLTTRLPGTGTALPAQDPHLNLDAGAGVLELATTQADFNGGAGLPGNSSPGVSLADFGFSGTEDFAVRAVFRPLPALEQIDQAGVYVGAGSNALTRAGTIVFGAPERYSTHSENGADHSGRFLGFGFDGSDGMTVTIIREAGVWRYFVDGVEWNPTAPPLFLDGLADLTAGVFAVTPLNANVKTVQIEEISVVVATGESCPGGWGGFHGRWGRHHDGDDDAFGCERRWPWGRWRD